MKEKNNGKQVLLNENISDIVYHFTTIEYLHNILSANSFVLSNRKERKMSTPNGYGYWMSVTRQKRGDIGFNHNNRFPVRITLDGRKFNEFNGVKGGACSYYQGRKESPKQHMSRGGMGDLGLSTYVESEDRIYSKMPILDSALRYMLRIDIFMPYSAERTQYQDFFKLLNNKHLNELVYIYGLEKDFIVQNNQYHHPNGNYGFKDVSREEILSIWNDFQDKDELLDIHPLVEWFDECRYLMGEESLIKVRYNDKWNVLDENLRLIINKPINGWMDDIGNRCSSGFIRICKDGKWNYIDLKGMWLLFEPYYEWFDKALDFEGKYAKVFYDYEWHTIDTDGKLDSVNENVMKKNTINESRLTKLKLPQFIFNRVKTHNTSLGDNEAFPPEGSYAFDYKLLKERFEEVTFAFHEAFGEMSEEQATNMMRALMKQCKEIERPFRANIEKMCENAIYSLFEVPEETVNFKCELVDKISPNRPQQIMPEDDEDSDYDFEDLTDYGAMTKEILKRRMIDALIQGASYEYTKVYHMFEDELGKLNEELIDIYDKIITINDYLLFTKKENITDKNPMQGAYVETLLGKGDDKTEISAQGIIFPFLLNESIRGFFELFASRGLPTDVKKANYILSKSEFLIAEPWDLRLGVGLWKYFVNITEDTTLLPYIFASLCELDVEEFNSTLKEIYAHTKRGRSLLDDLYDTALHRYEMEDFINVVNQKNAETSVLSDNYISADELDDYILQELNEVKAIGGSYYMHKSQAEQYRDIPKDVYDKAVALLRSKYPDYEYTHIMYCPKQERVRFDRSDDFDTCTEPEFVDAKDVYYNKGIVADGKHSGVWHHRQTWVDDDYQGFDLKRNKDWTDFYDSIIKRNQEIPSEIHQRSDKKYKGVPLKAKTPIGGSRTAWLMHLMWLDKMEGHGPVLINRYMRENNIENPIEYLSKYNEMSGNYQGKVLPLYQELNGAK